MLHGALRVCEGELMRDRDASNNGHNACNKWKLPHLHLQRNAIALIRRVGITYELQHVRPGTDCAVQRVGPLCGARRLYLASHAGCSDVIRTPIRKYSCKFFFHCTTYIHQMINMIFNTFHGRWATNT